MSAFSIISGLEEISENGYNKLWILDFILAGAQNKSWGICEVEMQPKA